MTLNHNPPLKDFNTILAEDSRHKMIGEDDAKIVFIGAGSAVWSSRIIIDLIINKDLRNVEVWLNDIDDHRLNLIYGFSTRYARECDGEILKERYGISSLTDTRRQPLHDPSHMVRDQPPLTASIHFSPESRSPSYSCLLYTSPSPRD